MLSAGPSGPTNVTSPSFSFSSTSAGATFECKLDTPSDAGGYAACTSPRDYTTTANGAYTFSVRAVRSGNADPMPATRSFTVDTVPPVATILTGPPTASEGLLQFTFASSEPGSTFECRLDQVEQPTSFYPCATPHTIGPVPNGSEYYFLLFATDAAGNSGPIAIYDLFSVGGISGHHHHRRSDPRHAVRSDDPDDGVVLVHVTEGRGRRSSASSNGPDGVLDSYAPRRGPEALTVRWPMAWTRSGQFTRHRGDGSSPRLRRRPSPSTPSPRTRRSRPVQAGTCSPAWRCSRSPRRRRMARCSNAGLIYGCPGDSTARIPG